MITVFFALYITQHIDVLKNIIFGDGRRDPKGELDSSFQRQIGELGGRGEGIKRERMRERKR